MNQSGERVLLGTEHCDVYGPQHWWVTLLAQDDGRGWLVICRYCTQAAFMLPAAEWEFGEPEWQYVPANWLFA